MLKINHSEDAQNVFRLSQKQLAELSAIHKEDPYQDDRLDIEQESVYTWYYLRDVWNKSREIYGEEIVNLWVC